ncbi:MAG: 6-phosphogluconolactonase, partial [Chitinophagaceae bacterium]
IALTGGNTPKEFYQLLATEKLKQQINWSRMHFFWGDERYVPFEDNRNNARMAFAALLNHVPVPENQIHKIRTDIEPQMAAQEYEEILRSYFFNQPATFDLVFLGLGDNAHTLSLFPGYDVIFEKEKWVTSFFLKEQNMHRITLTAPLVNLSKRTAFLVAGKEKAEAVQQVIQYPFEPAKYPAQIIQPVNGQLYWFLDEEASSKL